MGPVVENGYSAGVSALDDGPGWQPGAGIGSYMAQGQQASRGVDHFIEALQDGPCAFVQGQETQLHPMGCGQALGRYLEGGVFLVGEDEFIASLPVDAVEYGGNPVRHSMGQAQVGGVDAAEGGQLAAGFLQTLAVPLVIHDQRWTVLGDIVALVYEHLGDRGQGGCDAAGVEVDALPGQGDLCADRIDVHRSSCFWLRLGSARLCCAGAAKSNGLHAAA